MNPYLHWSDGIDMLSPREQRAHWISYMKLRWGIHRIGLAVNLRHCPQLKDHKVLRDMIDDGTVVRVRSRRYLGRSNVTILFLPEHLKEKKQMTAIIYMDNGQPLQEYVDNEIKRRVDEIYSDIEEDLMYARDALRDVIDWANDPNGFSRNALIGVAKRGLRE